MRMMLKVVIPVEAGNKAIKDGSLASAIKSTTERLKPEAAYFTTGEGERTALFFFDLKDVSQIPAFAEPLFMGLNASLTLSPVMTEDDVMKGMAEAAKKF
jgi:hypothetical protein